MGFSGCWTLCIVWYVRLLKGVQKGIDRRCLGGFTVLSTKAVSSLLTTNGFNMFKQWMTYPILAVSSCGYERAGTNSSM
jgi:hypothetical protein